MHRDLLQKLYPTVSFAEEEVRLDCLQIFCPNPHNHLYFNVFKGVGFCHRCSTPVTIKELVCLLTGVSLEEATATVEGVGEERLCLLSSRLEHLMSPKRPSTEDHLSVDLPLGFRPFSKKDASCFPYLKKRGIPNAVALAHKMGSCKQGRWNDRLIIPIYQNHKLQGFVGRSIYDPPRHLSKTGKKVWARAHSYVKVLNVKGFNSSKLLFNYDNVKEEMIITEGIFDALRCGSSGVALFGKRMSPHQETLIKRKNPLKIYIMLDSDAYVEGEEIAERLSSVGLNVFLAKVGHGKDPGSLMEDQIDLCLKKAKKISPLRIFYIKDKLKGLNL